MMKITKENNNNNEINQNEKNQEEINQNINNENIQNNQETNEINNKETRDKNNNEISQNEQNQEDTNQNTINENNQNQNEEILQSEQNEYEKIFKKSSSDISEFEEMISDLYNYVFDTNKNSKSKSLRKYTEIFDVDLQIVSLKKFLINMKKTPAKQTFNQTNLNLPS